MLPSITNCLIAMHYILQSVCIFLWHLPWGIAICFYIMLKMDFLIKSHLLLAITQRQACRRPILFCLVRIKAPPPQALCSSFKSPFPMLHYFYFLIKNSRQQICVPKRSTIEALIRHRLPSFSNDAASCAF